MRKSEPDSKYFGESCENEVFPVKTYKTRDSGELFCDEACPTTCPNPHFEPAKKIRAYCFQPNSVKNKYFYIKIEASKSYGDSPQKSPPKFFF